MNMLPKKVKIVEVGPRDGLQNEHKFVPTDIKIEFINALSEAGLSVIETTSFVSPTWVPQMADQNDIYSQINKKPGVSYPALVPNIKGLNAAIESGVSEISVFTAASETFSQKNTNCSIEESLSRIHAICEKALKNNIRVRGYISCVLGCPYEGKIAISKVQEIAQGLINFGCYEISLGDTIGVGTAGEAKNLIETLGKNIPIEKLAVHFHDTYGQALANIFACLELGISTIDSSAAGLGGCPYAPGAGGNVATEDVIYLLNGLNIETGVDLNQLINASTNVLKFLGHSTRSKTAEAILARGTAAEQPA
jgi:hydroxymethylglutaryl-CoA lyase